MFSSEPAVDFSQSNILRKLDTYFCQLGKNKPPLPPHCAGFTILFLYSIWLQTQPIVMNESYLTTPRSDFKWFIRSLIKIATWNERIDSLSEEDHQIFRQFYSHIKHFQDPDRYLQDTQQGDLDKILKYVDTNRRVLKREYSLAGCFTCDDLTKFNTYLDSDSNHTTIDPLLTLLVQEKRLIFIESHNHAIGIFSMEGVIYFYDSSSTDGPITFNKHQIQELAAAIFHSFRFDHDRRSPVAFRTFSFEQEPIAYPIQSVLLPAHQLPGQFDDGYGDNMTALHMAAMISCQASLEFHLLQYVNINAKDSLGYTALHYAILSQDLSVMRTLISHGADVNIARPDGETALSLAVKLENLEMVQILRDAGARENHDMTPCEIPDDTSKGNHNTDDLKSPQKRKYFFEESNQSNICTNDKKMPAQGPSKMARMHFI